jgi:hypothetical protein
MHHNVGKGDPATDHKASSQIHHRGHHGAAVVGSCGAPSAGVCAPLPAAPRAGVRLPCGRGHAACAPLPVKLPLPNVRRNTYVCLQQMQPRMERVCESGGISWSDGSRQIDR